MDNLSQYYKGHSTAEARWARFGPYYAMFPIDFAFNVVDKYSKPGDKILDPFSGRGSSIYAGSILGRESIGIEINPTAVKLLEKQQFMNRTNKQYMLGIWSDLGLFYQILIS